MLKFADNLSIFCWRNRREKINSSTAIKPEAISSYGGQAVPFKNEFLVKQAFQLKVWVRANVHQKSNFWSELDGVLILCGQDLYELIKSEKNNFRPKMAHLEGIEIDALEFFGWKFKIGQFQLFFFYSGRKNDFKKH